MLFNTLLIKTTVPSNESIFSVQACSLYYVPSLLILRNEPFSFLHDQLDIPNILIEISLLLFKIRWRRLDLRNELTLWSRSFNISCSKTNALLYLSNIGMSSFMIPKESSLLLVDQLKRLCLIISKNIYPQSQIFLINRDKYNYIINIC